MGGGVLVACCFGYVSPRFSETLADLICFMKGIDGSGRSVNENISVVHTRFTRLSLAHFSVSRQQRPKKPLHSLGINQPGRARR